MFVVLSNNCERGSVIWTAFARNVSSVYICMYNSTLIYDGLYWTHRRKGLRGIQPATLGLPAPALETVYVILYDVVLEKGR